MASVSLIPAPGTPEIPAISPPSVPDIPQQFISTPTPLIIQQAAPSDVYPHIPLPSDTGDDVITLDHSFQFQNHSILLSIRADRAIYREAQKPESKASQIYSDLTDQQITGNYYNALITDESQSHLYSSLVGQLQRIQQQYRLDDNEFIELATAYVQSIPYLTLDEEPKYPIETVLDHRGDCDDKSVLLAGILANGGYDVALLNFPEENHATVGIAVPRQYTYPNAEKYGIIETTDNWFVTEIPDTIYSVPHIIPIGSGRKTYTVAHEISQILESYHKAMDKINASAIYPDHAYNIAVDYVNLVSDCRDNAPHSRELLYRNSRPYY